jgi:hypothetical protein
MTCPSCQAKVSPKTSLCPKCGALVFKKTGQMQKFRDQFVDVSEKNPQIYITKTHKGDTLLGIFVAYLIVGLMLFLVEFTRIHGGGLGMIASVIFATQVKKHPMFAISFIISLLIFAVIGILFIFLATYSRQ